MQPVIRPVMCLSMGEVKFNVVAAHESRSAAYFEYGCQNFFIKQAQEANHRTNFALESPANRQTSLLSQLNSRHFSQASNQVSRQANKQ
jgi:hypothetical protein